MTENASPKRLAMHLMMAVLSATIIVALYPRDVDARTKNAEAVVIPSSLEVYGINVAPQLVFDTPTDIANAGDERLFVAERAGTISILTGRGRNAAKETFLDIEDRVTSGGEMGLLGLVFHPSYQDNGYFYVNYTTGEPATALQSRISRFQVSADPDRATPESELVLLTVDQPFANHNAGDLAFGPDGYLYFGLGDGGYSGSHGDPDNRAQNTDDLHGKLLRINVDETDASLNYGIPAGNPFVGKPGRDELWAIGLRNPWRFSFDSFTGDLYIGDVGQATWEEVNFQPADSVGGQNYGWKLKEGTHCYEPAENCDRSGLVDPIFEYNHRSGCSVTGGFVYRGQNYPVLQGVYIFADYCEGHIRALYRDDAEQWQQRIVGANIGKNVTTFGEDVNGELFLARNQGGIYKVTVRYRVLVPLASAP